MRTMKHKRLLLAVLLLAALLLLAACGEKIAEPVEPTPEPTPAPPTEYQLGSMTVPVEIETLDLSGTDVTLEDLMSLSGKLPSLREISLGLTEAELPQLRAVEAAFPEAELTWKVRVLGEELDCLAEHLDLRAATEEDVPALTAALSILPALKEVELAPAGEGLTPLSFESVDALAAAAPQADLNCRFELFGLTADWNTEELRYARKKLGNECIDSFRAALPYLRSLKLLRLQECGISDHEAMDALRDAYPEKNIVWTVYLNGWPFMTDTELIHFDILRDSDADNIKYLRDVLYLDIGHDTQLTNIEFVRYLPKLTTVILSLTNLSDISPLEACPEITFFEMFTTPVSDISVLSKLEKLEYVNLGNDWNLDDLSPLYGLKNLKLVRLGKKTMIHVTPQEVEELRSMLPAETMVNTDGGHPANSGGWRYKLEGGGWTDRYILLRKQCRYDYKREDSFCNSPSGEVKANG